MPPYFAEWYFFQFYTRTPLFSAKRRRGLGMKSPSRAGGLEPAAASGGNRQAECRKSQGALRATMRDSRNRSPNVSPYGEAIQAKPSGSEALPDGGLAHGSFMRKQAGGTSEIVRSASRDYARFPESLAQRRPHPSSLRDDTFPKGEGLKKRSFRADRTIFGNSIKKQGKRDAFPAE